jgi:hypothetical protein
VSYVRITEYTERPAAAAGEWYAVDGQPGSILIERDDAALAMTGGDGSAQPGAALVATPAAAAATHPDAGHVATRWTGVAIYRCGSAQPGSRLYLLKYPVPNDYLYEFDAWFQYEHMPMLLEEPTWYGCTFYRALGASCYAFAALHSLEPQALKSAARNASVDTAWWHRLKAHDWFDKGFVRKLLTPL